MGEGREGGRERGNYLKNDDSHKLSKVGAKKKISKNKNNEKRGKKIQITLYSIAKRRNKLQFKSFGIYIYINLVIANKEFKF